MKKIFTIILVACSSVASAQYSLGIRSVHQFPTTIVNGVPYQLGVYIVNEGSAPFYGEVDVLMAVNNTLPYFPLALHFNVTTALSGAPLNPGDSILWAVNGYIFPTSNFHAGVNDILIWPESQTTTIGSKYISQVNYIMSPVMRDSRISLFRMAPRSPSTLKMGDDETVGNLISNEFQLEVFPNPSADFISISSTQDGNFTIVSATGQLVGQFSSSNKKVDVSSFSAGQYFVRFRNESGDEIVKTFVKQ